MCRKFTSLLLLSLSLSLFSILPVCAQNGPDYDKKLQNNTNNKEDYSIRFMPWNQVWVQVMHHNPGTLINDVPLDCTFDTDARRMPLLVIAQIPHLRTGFYTQTDGTLSLQNAGLQSHDVFLLVGDAFLDLLSVDEARSMDLSAYPSFYHDEYGPHCMRHMGTMNIGAADPAYEGCRTISGPVNTSPMLGTGNLYDIQAGWLLPKCGKAAKIKCCHSPPVTTKTGCPAARRKLLGHKQQLLHPGPYHQDIWPVFSKAGLFRN